MMSTRYLPVAALLAALLVLGAVATGCGDSDSAEASLTKKQFVKRADAICKNAENEQFKRATAYAQQHPGAEQEDLIKPAGLPPLEKELQELEALAPPSGDETEVEAITEEFSKALEKVQEQPRAILSSDNPFDQANRAATTYGLKACGNAP